MILLAYVHYRWSMHLCDRLTSKSRKHPDERLPKKCKIAFRAGVILAVFYITHLAVVSWSKPIDAIVIWGCCYLMLTFFVIRSCRALRRSLREYDSILQAA